MFSRRFSRRRGRFSRKFPVCVLLARISSGGRFHPDRCR
jgi:hypothetical protein